MKVIGIIKSYKDLPDWYDLQKYEEASNLDSVGWYEQLLQRWAHNYYLRHYKEENETFSILYDSLKDLRKNAINSLTDEALIIIMDGGRLLGMKNFKDSYSKRSSSISSITPLRLYQLELKLPDKKQLRKYMDYFFGNNTDSKSFDQIKINDMNLSDFIHTPILETYNEQCGLLGSRNECDFIEVDLSLSNTILKQQFSNYLENKRNKRIKTNFAKNLKRYDLSKLIEYAVLPYIDLSTWATENNCCIPNRVMADAIFPLGEKGEEVVRKTTKKIADEVMNKDYIDFMATIVAHDIAERK